MTGLSLFVFLAVLLVAYANGANDIFKGVATLYGGGVTNYRLALLWAVGTTLAGSLLAALLAESLIKTFSGSGLVPPSVLADPSFVVAVALGAALTVFFSALAGIPISTTHALAGALIGAGFMAARTELNLAVLGDKFFLPLAVSPLLSIALVSSLFPLLRRTARRFGITGTSCICVSSVETVMIVSNDGRAALGDVHREFALVGSNASSCAPAAASEKLWKLEVAPLLRKLHFLSAGAVSFARGTNDTPKIVGIALLAGAFHLQISVVLIAIVMAAGGLLHSRRIAETMATRILPFDEAEGTLANLVMSFLVIVASQFGMPVSTTHVSVGSLFGLGISKGRAHWDVVSGIALSWLLTLPVAMAAAALIFIFVRHLGL